MSDGGKCKIVSKERALHPDFGYGPTRDALYWATSGSVWAGQPRYIQFTDEAGALAAFVDGYTNRNTLTNYASNLGKESIVTVVGSRRSMNSCVHHKLHVVNRPFLALHEDQSSSSYCYWEQYWREPNSTFVPGLGEVASSLADTFIPGNDSGFSARAFWSMRPKFQGDVSLINSIFELKDFRDIVNLKKIYNRFRNVSSSKNMSSYASKFRKLAKENNVPAKLQERYGIKSYSDAPSGVLNALARDLSGTAATAILAINLAIKPTIADVLAITAQLLTSVEEAQNTFRDFGEKGSSSHFSEVDVIQGLTPSTKNYYFREYGFQTVIKRTATMYSQYHYKMRKHNQALVKYWGLSGTVEALWNMLPLSFVLDYVFTIGKVLSYMDVDNNVDVQKLEYCESVKITATNGVHYALSPRMHALVLAGKYYKRPQSSVKQRLLVSGTECTRYNRKPMEPYKGPALPKFKRPSTTQAANILALIRCFSS